MTGLSNLELQAIAAAKAQNWEDAVKVNEEILAQKPNDLGALMRIGVAYAQLGDAAQAKKCFLTVLDLDRSNTLAKKHLEKLKNHQPISSSSLPSDVQFIEEPGKTKTVELHRLAGKEQLTHMHIGQECTLKPKNRFVSVEVARAYVGSLPEDISARLTKLIKNGNTYTCYIQSISPTTCSVFIKEVARSKENEFINSFPVSKNHLSSLNDIFFTNDAIPLVEDIPPQIVVTDADEEKTLDSFSIEEPMEESHHHHQESDDSDDEN